MLHDERQSGKDVEASDRGLF